MSQAWQDYCLKCVEEAREYATQNGVTIQTAMLHILDVLIPEAMARFPDVGLRVALHELAWWAARAEREAGKRLLN